MRFTLEFWTDRQKLIRISVYRPNANFARALAEAIIRLAPEITAYRIIEGEWRPLREQPKGSFQ